MPIRGIKRNFTGGEVAPTVEPRDDLAKFQTSCRFMRNFIAQLHGGARYRGGWQFVADLGGEAWLKPFAFNADPEDAYALIFTDKVLRFAQDDGLVLDGESPYQVASPYGPLAFHRLSEIQSGDVVYFAHPGYDPFKLARAAHTDWTFGAINFGTEIGAPSITSIAWSGQTGGTFTQKYRVCAVSEKGEVSESSPAVGIDTAYPPGDWIKGDSITINWSSVEGAEEYNIYKEEGGIYGLIGVSVTSPFIDNNYKPSATEGPQEANNPFADGNHPGIVTLHQQRLVWGRSDKSTQTIWGSQIANYENMNKTRPVQADSSYEHTIVGDGVNEIMWMVSFGDLLVGTAGAEHKLFANNGGSITPLDAVAKAQSYWGSAGIAPLVIGNSVLHVGAKETGVRDLFFSLEKDGYAGNDLSVLADHFFDGHTIMDWTYQQKPDSVVWAVRDDGVLLGMTYLKEHEIWGWHLHETDGRFRSVVTVPGETEDILYAVIEREINGQTKYYLEKYAPKWRASDGIENAFYVDSGLSTVGKPITAITQTNPVKVTVVGHGVTTGEEVLIENAEGMTELNGQRFTITEVDNDNFTLDGVDGTGYSAYTTGGLSWRYRTAVTGLDHLDGKEVVALADGSPETGLTVVDGTINLSAPAAKIHAGLPYFGILAPLTYEAETKQGVTQGRERGFGRTLARLHETVGGKSGLYKNVKGATSTPDVDGKYYPLKTTPTHWDQPIEPFTGHVELPIGGGFSKDATLCIVQDQPLPMTVMSLISEVAIGG